VAKCQKNATHVIGLFSNNVVSFSSNVVLRGLPKISGLKAV
jgi:hypothetical protein